MAKKMNKTGKYIVYLLLSLFTTAALISSCTDRNGLGDPDHPNDKTSLSISFHSAQQTRVGNGPRSNEIGEDVIERESAIYSLAVLVFKNGNNELDGKKFIDREIIEIPGSGYKDYKELDEIKGIELTSGIRDVYIIANAPDGHFSNVTDRPSFRAKLEELSAQGVYDHPEGGGTSSGDIPIGGEEPDDRHTNLVMTQSFTGLPVNSGAKKHYLGYTGNGGLPDGETTGTPLNGTNPVELVRLVARVAIQKIAFDLPEMLAFDGYSTREYNHYVDTVFMINAKTVSSYFPEDGTFPNPEGFFGHGNTIGYEFLKNQSPSVADGSTYAAYLYKPINFKEYDITQNQVPLWFYAFENKDSASSPTGFVIGVKYQYKGPGNELKRKKVYYPVVVNSAGGGSGGNNHRYIKRNNQYGIKVTIKGLGSYVANYPEVKSAVLPPMNSLWNAAGTVEIEETVGTDLFPWTGNVYK